MTSFNRQLRIDQHKPFHSVMVVKSTPIEVAPLHSSNMNSINNSNSTSIDEQAVSNSLPSKPKATDLLRQYGIAYLTTSVSLTLVSFALCYYFVSIGIDVPSALSKVGIKPTKTAANAGTFGIAYALHKALSPVRFPPTVLLTPIVSSWMYKNKKKQA